jgi:hypothetical protein
MTKFEENNPEQLKEFIKQFRMLMDEYHPNTYLIDDVWVGARTIELAIENKLNELDSDYNSHLQIKYSVIE